jgi:hypothetical protein
MNFAAGSGNSIDRDKEERKMQDRKNMEQRKAAIFPERPVMKPKPVDVEIDFEGLPMAWKEARDSFDRIR